MCTFSSKQLSMIPFYFCAGCLIFKGKLMEDELCNLTQEKLRVITLRGDKYVLYTI